MMCQEELKLKNQLCFRAYTSSRLTIRLYKPILDKLNLTYPQYVAMLILWEEESIGFRDLGKKLYMKTGTLTPLIQRLEKLKYVVKIKDPEDDRKTIVQITPDGKALLPIANDIPKMIAQALELTQEEYLEYTKTMDALLEKLYKANGFMD